MGRVKIPKKELWRAIREHCKWCVDWEPSEIKSCPFKECSLYPYRMGRPLTEKEIDEENENI